MATQKVLVLCDAMAVVHSVNNYKCRDKTLSQLLCSLHFFLAQYDKHLRTKHLRVKNTAADAVSRNLMQVFNQTLPETDNQSAFISATLWNLLVVQAPDWMSPS